MLDIYQTPTDILFLVLTIAIIVIVILGALVLYHFISILRNVNRVTSLTESTVELINHYLWQPIKFFNKVVEKAGKHSEKAAAKAQKAAKKAVKKMQKK